jgi:hypothetical protein
MSDEELPVAMHAPREGSLRASPSESCVLVTCGRRRGSVVVATLEQPADLTADLRKEPVHLR